MKTYHNFAVIFRFLVAGLCLVFGVSTVSATSYAGRVDGVPLDLYLGPNQPIPLESVAITGPTTGLFGMSSIFTATVTPLSATLPITYVWESTWPWQAPVTHVQQQLTDTVIFTWTMVSLFVPAEQQVSVQATNAGGESVTDTHTISVGSEQAHSITLYDLQRTVGGISSGYVITNTGGATASVVHDFYTDNGTSIPAASLSGEIAAGTTQLYDLATMTDLPDGYTGYAIVSSDQPITGTVFEPELPVPYAPTLDPINNGDGDGNYIVQWHYTYDDPPVDTYTLQQATDASFTTEVVDYSQSDTSRTFTAQEAGTYYYRVRGHNSYGTGQWSQVQSVVVEATPAPLVSSIEPDNGPDNEITWVTIYGANFVATPSVVLGGTELSGVSLVNTSELLAAVPAGMAPGLYDVQVCNPDEQCGVLPEGYTVTGSGPILTSIVPNQGFGDVPNDVTLYGYNLQADLVAVVGTTFLEDVTWVNAQQVRAVIPAGLAVGTHDVTARNPASADTATLADGYLVLDPAGDDFSVSTEDIWTTPLTIREGDEVLLGVNVHRQGGKQTLQPQVAFYQGDPQQDGVLLGTASTPPMLPGAGVVDAASILWDTTAIGAGSVKIYVVIDADQAISETSELNNTAARYLTVLSAAEDAVPPVVTSFMINDGAASTAVPSVTVTMVADDGDGTGVSSMYLVEREFNASARQWVAVQHVGWMPFQSPYTMTLTERGGTRYVQAWVADGAGNISEAVYKARIDYVPETQTIRAGQVHLYRRELLLGQTLSVTLETLSGDADLYVWRPDGERSWVSNQPDLLTDAVSLTASQTGIYQIEVYGYVASEYSLQIRTGDMLNVLNAFEAEQMKLDKPIRSQPIIQPDNEPEGNIAVPLAPIQPVTFKYIFLPLVLRGG